MPAALLIGARLALPSVTLVAASSVALEATALAIRQCMDQIDFAEVIWCSDSPPPSILGPTVRLCQIDKLASRQAYSDFVLRKLHSEISTEHVLLVQWDGFVVNASAWDDAFLNCDYLGAAWPQFTDGHVVGNGGFSLRSKRLLAATAKLPKTEEAEDLAICRTWRRTLEQDHGLKFGSVTMADRFSYERSLAGRATFGFHGVFNLPRHLSALELRRRIRTLEPHVMASAEVNELFWHGIRTGDLALAWLMAWRKCAKLALRRREKTFEITT